MFDKERFHNELAMQLGYERILGDCHISIDVVETDDPLIRLGVQGCEEQILFKASEIGEKSIGNDHVADEMRYFVDAVHRAFIEITKERFASYLG